MVKVITIMDDVYSELYSLKKSKGMSFSQAIRYLLKERREGNTGLFNLAGSIEEKDIDRSAKERISRQMDGVRG